MTPWAPVGAKKAFELWTRTLDLLNVALAQLDVELAQPDVALAQLDLDLLSSLESPRPNPKPEAV